MTPTPEQVAQWAREEATAMGSMSMFATLQHWRDEHQRRLVTRAMAEQAEADAKLCEQDLRDEYLRQQRPIQDEVMLLAAIADCAAAIRDNAPKVTT